MKAIILAAGRGSRLESILPNTPKCLLTFGEKTLILHQISALAEVGVREFVIVVGYEKQQIINHLEPLQRTYRFTFIENPLFARTNTIYSLWLASKDHFNDDFIYFNADVLFDYRIVKKLAAPSAEPLLACITHACGDEEVKVILDGSRIVEIGKKIDPARSFGEFIGIAKFPRAVNPRFAAILDECIRDESLWNNVFEYAVNILAKDAHLRHVDITEFPAAEIDFPADWEYAKNVIYPKLAQRRI